MNLVLDTNALWDTGLFDALARANAAYPTGPGGVHAVVPAVAYAERVRQMRAKPGGVDLLRATLDRAGVEVEAFGREQAERIPPGALDPAAWRAHGRDFLIAAHAREGRIIVTDDQGPAWEGLDVLTPGQATELVEVLVG